MAEQTERDKPQNGGVPKKKKKKSAPAMPDGKAPAFQHLIGECWIGPQRWRIEFCNEDVEASFRRRVYSAPVELGKTIWHGTDNVIRINAEMLLAHSHVEIVNTIIHEIGHVAMEGRYSILSGLTPAQVEDILSAIDSYIGQGLMSLGLIRADFSQAKAEYEQFLQKRQKQSKKAGSVSLCQSSHSPHKKPSSRR